MNTDSQIKACILQNNSSLFPSRMNRPLRAPTKKDFFTMAICIIEPPPLSGLLKLKTTFTKNAQISVLLNTYFIRRVLT